MKRCIALLLLSVSVCFGSPPPTPMPDPLPLIPQPLRIRYSPLNGVLIAEAGPSPASGPSDANQVSVSVFDSVKNALRIENGSGTGGGTPTDANQVFTSIYDAATNTVRVNCISGCGTAVTSPATNGVVYTNASGALFSTATGGAGIQCLISNGGGTPGFGACSGSASTAWSSLSAPSANLALAVGNFTTTFTAGAATGTTNPFSIIDTTGNTGTAALFNVNTVGTSTALPVQFTAKGTANGVQMSSSGILAPIGTGGITANAFSGTLPIANGGTGAATLAGASLPVFTGTITTGDCTKWASATSITDAGAACGSGTGMAIGGTVTSGTTGSALFVGAGPVLSQDNANFFWDSTNHRLGLGTTAPDVPLTVNANANSTFPAVVAGTLFHTVGVDASDARWQLDAFGTGATPGLTFEAARGTNAARSALQSGDILGLISGRGYGATGYSSGSRASCSFMTTQIWTDTAQGSDIVCSTTPNGSVTQANALKIDQDGSLNMLAGHALNLFGSTSGDVSVQVPATVTTYSLIFPSTAGSANQCLANGATPGTLTFAACGSGGAPALTATQVGYGSASNLLTGDANFTRNNTTGAVSIQPIAAQDAVPLTIAPVVASPTADIFDVFKDSAKTTKALSVDSSGNTTMLGNFWQVGQTGQTTASHSVFYGGSTSSAGPYQLFEDSTGAHPTQLYFDPVNGDCVNIVASATPLTGACSSSDTELTHNSINVPGAITANSIATNSTGPFAVTGTEAAMGAPCTAAAGKDVLCLGDSATHTAQLSLNNGSFLPVPQWSSTTPTAHGVVVVGATFPQHASTGAGATGQILISNGASADPTYGDFPETDKVIAANCNNATAGAGWSIGSGGSVTCRAGTNNLGGFVTITDTATTFAQFSIPIPEDWDSNTNPFIRFGIASTDITSGHTIIPQIKVSCEKGDGTTTDDVAFNAAHSSSTITLNTTANQFWSNSNVQLNSTDVTGCVAGAMMIVQVGRATDTATNAEFYYANVTFPRKLVMQAN